MKHFILILITTIFLLEVGLVSAQNFAPKDYYLVDSLNLDNVTESDKSLIDSCLKKFHSFNDDTIKLDAIGLIVEGSWNADVWPKYNKWIYDFVTKKLIKENELPESVADKFNTHYASSLNNFGVFHSQRGSSIIALGYYRKSLAIHKKLGDKKEEAAALNNIGFIYLIQDDIENALEYLNRSLLIRENIGDSMGVAVSLSNLASAYTEQNEKEKSIHYHKKSLRIREEIRDKRGMATSLNNIANLIGSNRDSIGVALKYLKRSLTYNKEIGYEIGIANDYQAMANLLVMKDSLKAGFDLFNKAIIIQKKRGDKLALTYTYLAVGRLKNDMGYIEEALYYCKKGLSIAEEIGSIKLISQLSLLYYLIEVKKNNLAKALEMYKRHILMRDSINGVESQKATIRLESKYKYEKELLIQEEKSLAQLKEQELIANEDKKRRNIIILSISGGLTLLLLFLFFLNKRYRLIKSQKAIIDKQKGVVEEKNREITDSINYAKRIQDAIVPPVKKVKELLPYSFVLYRPKDIVSGDFYWLEKPSHRISKGEEAVLFAVADCTGHGVPGAMVSVVCNNSLNQAVKEFNLAHPAEILDKTRSLVLETFDSKGNEVKDGMDIALCSMSIAGAKAYKELEYAGANNPLWLVTTREDIGLKSVKLFDENNKLWLHEIKADKQPIGEYHGQAPFTSHKVELIEGDIFYLFSDGYPDQFGGGKGKKMKYRPFKQFLLSIHNLNMIEQEKELAKYFDEWKGNHEQVDDVCVMGVRV